MEKIRKYGTPPYVAAVVHGGPGAAGEMAPVALELAANRGVLEPLQTATSLDGQVSELSALLREYSAIPVVLIGFSWGAWLSLIVAAAHSALIKKLILVGSGPIEDMYADEIQKNRLKRLGKKERSKYRSVINKLNDPDTRPKSSEFDSFSNEMSSTRL